MSFLGLFQDNMQTGILVLVVILLLILCVAFYFTHREVRDLRFAVSKNRHDIQAVQSLLSETGLAAIGEEQKEDSFRGGAPVSRFPPPGMIPRGMTSSFHPDILLNHSEPMGKDDGSGLGPDQVLQPVVEDVEEEDKDEIVLEADNANEPVVVQAESKEEVVSSLVKEEVKPVNKVENNEDSSDESSDDETSDDESSDEESD